jgi:HEAT repeat protein/beta-lactamase regulating signal transducer with metallopeptidase domain
MRAFLDGTVEPALWSLGDWSLRWAVLIGLLAGGLALLRPRRADTRHRCLLTVLLAGLTLPVLPRWGPAVGPAAPAGGAGQTTDDLDSPPPGTAPADPTPPVFTARHRTDAPPAPGVAPPGPAPEPFGTRRVVVLALGLAWAASVLLMLARWAGGVWFLRRLRRTAVAVAGRPAGLFAACLGEMGLRHRSVLASHPLVRSPVLCGVLRPMILVPADWGLLPEAAQRAALLHELAHLARGDHRAAPLLYAVRIAFFFHPPVRWLLAQLECERELLCDEAAVARGVEPRDYAALLLEFARSGGRLGPALSRLGKRTTIKTRIHHLLEENMEPRLTPLTRRGALALGALLLTLTAALGGLRLRAREPERPVNPGAPPVPPAPAANDDSPSGQAPASPPREDLRYGGKSFGQWRRELTTELKPAVRVEGIKALSAFGANGYATEAVEAILEVMNGYHGHTLSDPEDRPVYDAAKWACNKIGPAAVPALRKGLGDTRKNVRTFAVLALQFMGPMARPADAALVERIKDEDPDIRYDAIEAVVRADPKVKGLVPALVAALKDEVPRVRERAALALGQVGPGALPAAPALVEALKDPEANVRLQALRSLDRIGFRDESLTPALAARVKDDNEVIRLEAVQYLTELGPKAAGAVPALVGALAEDVTGVNAILALAAIGPDAKAAVPALNAMLPGAREGVRGEIIKALSKINK